MTYLVVHDSEDRGVYAFDSRGVAEKTAANFKNYVFMHEDEREKALALAGVTEVTDALFLIRKYNSKKREGKPTAQTERTSVEEKKAVPTHNFVKVFNKMKEMGNTIRIGMVNGDEYLVSVKSYFLKMADYKHDNLIMVVDGEVRANEAVLDAAVEKGLITVLPKTRIDYVDNYMILNGCDDRYSPNPVDAPFCHYEHQYSRVAINMDQVSNVSVVNDFEFGSNTVIKVDAVVKYLVKKML